MANMRVKQALEKIDEEINKVGKHILHYSGIDAKDALRIKWAAQDISKTAAQIEQLADETLGISSRGQPK